MTPAEIVYDVKERLNINSDDKSFEFPDRHIMFVYEDSRAQVFNEKLNRSGRMVDGELYQTILVPMETVDRSFCPLVPVGCKILRSKEMIPDLMYLHNHALVDRVGPNDILSKKYKFIEYTAIANVYGGTFSNRYVYTFVLGGYLYAVSKNKLVNTIKNLVMRAVFERPSEVLESTLCSEIAGGSCSQYPMKLKYHTNTVLLTLDKLSPKYQLPLDESNDANPGMSPVKMPKKNAAKN